MIRIDIRPVWSFRSGEEREFDFRMVPLLEGIEVTGKLTQAARHAGISYRHAWNLIEQWTGFFGAPLVVMQKGRGTHLTDLGSHLLWAGKRAQARLEPELRSLASEFERALNDSLHDATLALDLHASHDFAVALLVEQSMASGISVDCQYTGSFEALDALRRRECDLAGFHLPIGPLAESMARRYRETLAGSDIAVLSFVTREQGLIVRSGNPKEIRGIADLARKDVRFINRQRGSGTRALLEQLVTAAALDRARIRGYGLEEVTHSAVAALIAGNQADVGLGAEAAAAQFRLGFVPVCRERYVFACRREMLDNPAVERLQLEIRSARFEAAVSALAGYHLEQPGDVIEYEDLLADATPTRIPTETP